MKEYFFVCLLLLIIGCISEPGAKDFALEQKEVKDFLEKYPDPVFKETFLDLDSVTNYFSKLKEDCGEKIILQPYWEVEMRSEGKIFLLYADEQLTTVHCVINPTENYFEENDCQSNRECLDDDPYTKNLCLGTPKKCVVQKLLCKEARGEVCKSSQRCLGTIFEAEDVEACCVGGCREKNSCLRVRCPVEEICREGKCINPVKNICDNVKCTIDKKCVEGVCVFKECSERGGFLCEGIFKCEGSNLPSSEIGVCCDRECVKASCVELNGIICGTGLSCDGKIIDSINGPVCCVGNCVETPQ
jgi:hypothetical protein